MTNSRTKGKRVERDIAHRMGTNRNHSDGMSHTDIYPEADNADYVVEVKARKQLPQWIHDAMQQAIDDPKRIKEGRTPIVVMVESKIGQKPLRYVMMRFDDFVNERNFHDLRTVGVHDAGAEGTEAVL